MALPFQTYTARLAERTDHTPMFIEYHFELVSPSRIAFKSGQYVLLNVPTTPQKKSYSIVSPPQMDHAIELLVDIHPDGPGSRYLAALQPGDEISFMAPFGNFVLAPPDSPVGVEEKHLAFVATGSGIAPMRSFLEDLLVGQGDQRPMTLYWGLRYPEDQLWYEDFELLAQEHPNFTFHPTLSRPTDDWPLCRGRVTDCLTVHAQPALTGYYVCGSSAMIEDVTGVLKKLGVTPEHIHHEKFF